jgi:two-component system chemotaxis response regulator CheB
MISVLVVEDSRVEQELLVRVLETDPDVHVVAVAHDGAEAVELVDRYRPDVITMDLMMPRMDGFEATRRIMETTPRPIVVVSGSWGCEEVARAAKAIEAGAVAGVLKPRASAAEQHDELRQELLRTLKLVAGVKVVRRWARRRNGNDHSSIGESTAAIDGLNVVAIGVSTGGPPVLEAVLSRLPSNFPVPILVVQHIAEGFVDGLIEWLRRSTHLGIHLAEQEQVAYGGQVYLAPDGYHMGIDEEGRILLEHAPCEYSQRPAVSYLFRSVGEVYGARAVGALLTGMGRDGAKELRDLREQGAVTIAQSAETCAVFGMPAEAIRLEAARYVLPPEEIGDLLCALAGVKGAADCASVQVSNHSSQARRTR